MRHTHSHTSEYPTILSSLTHIHMNKHRHSQRPSFFALYFSKHCLLLSLPLSLSLSHTPTTHTHRDRVFLHYISANIVCVSLSLSLSLSHTHTHTHTDTHLKNITTKLL